MLNKTIRSFASLSLLIIFGCEEPVEENGTVQVVNTTNENSIGDGTVGAVDDYFYNFDYNIDADFYNYPQADLGLNYSTYLGFKGAEPPTLNLRTFPEYLVKINPGQVEYSQRTVIDSLTRSDVVVTDSVKLFSEDFRDVEYYQWDFTALIENQRYKPTNSSEVVQTDTTIYYQDTLDVYGYRAVVDTPVISQGIMFVDADEWVDTTYTYENTTPQLFSNQFVLQRWQLSADSLMFRINTDCNDNGNLDAAEDEVAVGTPGAIWDDDEGIWFADRGNGVFDLAEPFHDANSDSTRNGTEAFQDRNCNGAWDDQEEIVDSLNTGALYDPIFDVWFIDRGNGKYDDQELYTDLNHNNVYDSGELFTLGDIPNNLLVDYSDPLNPQVITYIGQSDSLVARWGGTYYNMIEEVDFIDNKVASRFLKDSTVTLVTNKIVAHITDAGSDDDYLITKTEWGSPKQYDYLLFRQNENVHHLVRPSYFKPYGYYTSTDEHNDGFWYQDFFRDEIFYYTPDGQLRDGERVEWSYVDTTRVAIYRIERSFAVDAAEVKVPAARVRGVVGDDGTVECKAVDNWPAATVDDCPGADTTFTDCFKITRDLTMTMVGTGVEYGERNVTWLAKDFGIVKDEVFVTWGGYAGGAWDTVAFGRWELNQLDLTPVAGNKGLSRLVGNAREIPLNELDQVPEFDGDPFNFRRTAGFQRVNISND